MRNTLRRLFLVVTGFALLPRWAVAQEPVTLSGRVTTEAGVPLGYAEVVVASLGLGAVTRDDGRYAIVIPGARATVGQTIAVTARRLGYKAVTAQLTLSAGIVEHDFALGLNPLQLGEIVATGAGTATAAEKLGNARNNVDSSSIQRSNEPNLVQTLAGKAPNVEVTQASGEPGAASYIRIRGARTFSGNSQPLFVVDGVPMDNSSFADGSWDPVDGSGAFDLTSQMNRAVDLNPNDVESVDILKGAAAGAIYGARAAQGVVLITTKSGRAGATRFTYRSTASFDDINHTYPLQTRFGQGTFGNAPTPGTCEQALNGGICTRSWGPDLTGGQVFDHANEAYNTGRQFENAITVSGGNDRTTFYLSGENNFNNGIFVGDNDQFSRTTFRVKGSHRLTDNLKITGNMAYADTRGRFIQRGNNVNGLQLGLLRTPPNFNNLPYLDTLYHLHRSYRFQNPGPGDLVADRGFDNPFYVIYEQRNTSNVGRVMGNMAAEYLATSWLKVNYTLGADYSNDERLEGCPISSSDVCFSGRVIEGKIVNYQIDHNLTATASFRVNDNMSGTFTLGQGLNTRNFRQIGAVGRTLVAPQPFKLSNTVSRDPLIDDETVVHNESYFGQATLDVASQLYLTVAARNDGSSTFGLKNQRNWFPKASAAWEFTKSSVFPQQSWLNYGKLRLAYGQAGKEPDPYLTSTTFSSGLLSGIAQGTGLTPTQNGIGGLATGATRGASVLKPERTAELEGGLDLSMLRDRVDLHYTYYNAKTYDIILLLPLAPSTGYQQEARNAAKLRNTGHELSLNFRPVTTAQYEWNVGLQWARNRSDVTDLAGADHISLSNTFVDNVAQIGQELGAIRGYGFVRCGVTDPNFIATLPNGTTSCSGASHGALYVDSSGFPVEDPDPRIIGNPNPRWTGSVSTSFRYGRLQVSGLLDIRHGGQMWNGSKGALWSYGTHKDTEVRATCTGSTAADCTGNLKTFGSGGYMLDGPVVGPGAGLQVPIGENWFRFGDAPCPFSGYDEQCIEDAGFVKLREISVTYTLDQPWVRRSLGLSSVDVRVSGRNLKTWTKYTGYDPETNLGGSIATVLGADYFNMPQTRSFVFSITLNR